MSDKEYYWKIRYEIDFLTDFHVGSGTILLGGNLHGVRLLTPHNEEDQNESDDGKCLHGNVQLVEIP